MSHFTHGLRTALPLQVHLCSSLTLSIHLSVILPLPFFLSFFPAVVVFFSFLGFVFIFFFPCTLPCTVICRACCTVRDISPRSDERGSTRIASKSNQEDSIRLRYMQYGWRMFLFFFWPVRACAITGDDLFLVISCGQPWWLSYKPPLSVQVEWNSFCARGIQLRR